MTSAYEALKSLPPDATVSAELLLAVMASLTAPAAPSKTKAEPITPSTWDDEKLISPETLAEWLGRSTHTLELWRKRSGDGPPFVKQPKLVRYQVGKVKEWVANRTSGSTTEAGQKGHNRLEINETAYPVITYPDGIRRSLEGSVAHELETEASPMSFRIVNMGMQKDGEIYKALANDPSAAQKLLGKDAAKFDVALWLYHQTMYGRLPDHGPYLDAVRLLINRGLDINLSQNDKGYTVAHVLGLHQNCFVYYNEFVTAMLGFGLNLEQQDNSFMTALDYALEDCEEAESPLFQIHKRASFSKFLEENLKK